MEPMQIEIESLVVENQCVEAHARAVAEAADIRLLVRFRRPSYATKEVLLLLARQEVLRYLDPA